jgi:hypothetical protein
LDASSGTEYYTDSDGDGFGDSASSSWSCEQPDGSVDNGSDCDDANADVNPDAAEVCDEVDNNCDGDIDDDDANVDASAGMMYYEDYDEDGYGDPDVGWQACVQPDGYVMDMTDCDDMDAALNQDDADADGLTSCQWDCDDFNNAIGATDEDGDGAIACYDDCDDTDASLNNDDADGDGFSICDGDCDDEDPDVDVQDDDADGYSACLDDCDDSSDTTYPGAAYNEMDETACLNDADGDGYGNYMGSYSISCFDIEMTDTYGDSWTGNAIQVYEDGVVIQSYANENLDGITGAKPKPPHIVWMLQPQWFILYSSMVLSTVRLSLPFQMQTVVKYWVWEKVLESTQSAGTVWNTEIQKPSTPLKMLTTLLA